MARFILRYRGYNYTQKNPVIDKVRTLLQEEGLYSKKKRNLLHQLTGVAVATYDGWFEGDTIDPRHTTIAATIGALGYEERFVKTKELDMDAELKAARAWNERQKAAREKAKALVGEQSARKSNGAKRSKR